MADTGFNIDVTGEGRSNVETGPNLLGGIGAQTNYIGGNPTAALVFNRAADVVQSIPPWVYAAAIGGVVLIFFLRGRR